ncbi:MAG: bifunctional phosphopantothenoylcysteine decarboxylase/phosphopantothenate--cysteine ligase CoaBC [Armatimonadaceae bacterium]
MNAAFPTASPLAGKTVVLGVAGSISAYKAADLCSKLVQEGTTVLPILTRAALRFVGAPTFWGLAGQPVATDVFDEPFGPQEIAHLVYPERADLFVVAPASADVLARLAAGMCDDMLAAALIANPGKPVLIAPAMNTDMWKNPAVQANRRTLESRGYQFVEPGVGRLAEGLVGAGRLAEPPEIVAIIKETLARQQDFQGVSFLITAGPTREPLDPVRYLTNRSSGKMGYALAEAAATRGAKVTLVSGPVHLSALPGVETIRVTTASEMAEACFEQATTANVIIAAAAVADYTPATVAPQKIKKSGGDTLTITLRPTEDILKTLGQRKTAGQVLVGFAAETEHVTENAHAKLAAKNLDLIVANDVTQPSAGFDTDTNIVTLIGHGNSAETLPQMPKRAVADAILDRVKPFLAKA